MHGIYYTPFLRLWEVAAAEKSVCNSREYYAIYNNAEKINMFDILK